MSAPADRNWKLTCRVDGDALRRRAATWLPASPSRRWPSPGPTPCPRTSAASSAWSSPSSAWPSSSWSASAVVGGARGRGRRRRGRSDRRSWSSSSWSWSTSWWTSGSSAALVAAASVVARREVAELDEQAESTAIATARTATAASLGDGGRQRRTGEHEPGTARMLAWRAPAVTSVPDLHAAQRPSEVVEAKYRGDMPLKQEQERAGEEVVEVAPGILRLQLPVDLPGLGHANCYALEDERGLAVIDPGLPGDASWDALLARLRQVGAPVSRIHTVVVTHSHPDHFGLAGRLQSENGAELLTHESFRTWWNPETRHRRPRRRRPGRRRSRRRRRRDRSALGAQDAVGQRELPAAGRDGRCRPRRVPRPARQPDADDPGARMPRWSPRAPGVGGRPHPWPHARSPLPARPGRRRAVLRRPRAAIDHAAHLGHRPVRGSAHGVLRVARPHGRPRGRRRSCYRPTASRSPTSPAGPSDIKRHHEERLERLRSASVELGRAATVTELSQRLFNPRAWGPMADSETYAHLEHLRLVRPSHQPCRERRAALLDLLTAHPAAPTTRFGSVFEPHTTTTTRSLGLGDVGARQDRGQCRRAARLGHEPQRGPQRPLGVADGVVAARRPRRARTARPPPTAPRRSAWRPTSRRPGPTTETSTGSPAASASRMAGISSGSTLTTFAPPRYQDAAPAISPPPPTATSTVVGLRLLLVQLARHRALAGDDVGVVVRVDEQGGGGLLRRGRRPLPARRRRSRRRGPAGRRSPRCARASAATSSQARTPRRADRGPDRRRPPRHRGCPRRRPPAPPADARARLRPARG